ncbi:MAG TPA: IS4 family transposase [Verrucomicrobiae bacterium]
MLFRETDLRQLAKNLKFTKRTPRKIDVINLLAAVCTECLQGSPSCNDLAARIQTLSGHTPSRQAVSLRLNQAFADLVQQLLEKVINQKVTGNASPGLEPLPAFRNYRRVLVQDSTIIKLPGHLFEDFSGVANAHASVCNARIQATYNLLDHRLLAVTIDPYSKNYQTAAPELSLQKDDLVLRDRGYLVMDEIQRHREAGADCIYQHRTGTTYLDPQSGEPIDLLALLKNQGALDLEVLLNNAARTRVRLLSVPVDVETANRRRCKAKIETHGHRPSKAVLELMDWTIFITTIPAALASYGLRWRVEIIFKAWKNHLQFPLLHRVSKLQLAILLKARLLIITACINLALGTLERTLRQNYNPQLSLLKFTRFLSKSPARYCCYDQRQRQNYPKMWDALA